MYYLKVYNYRFLLKIWARPLVIIETDVIYVVIGHIENVENLIYFWDWVEATNIGIIL